MAKRKVAVESDHAGSGVAPVEQEKHPGRSAEPQFKRLIAVASGMAALLLFFFTYWLRLDHTVGFYVDDAWYLVLAKSLASGQGYTLINSPVPIFMPLYPPAYPFLLSFIFRFAPEFPNNVFWLKSISIVAMCGVGLAAYRYFTRSRELPPMLALGIAVATVLCPGLVFMATSTTLSECVFMLAQLLTLIVIEQGVRAAKKGHTAWPYLLLAASCASFAFLTRSMAIGLVAAVGCYLLKERLVRSALIFAAGMAIFVGPWMFYVRMHYPPAEQLEVQNSYVTQSYATHFWKVKAGQSSSGQASTGDILERMWDNAVNTLGRDASGMVVAPLLRDATRSGEEAIGVKGDTVGFLFIFSALAMVGFIWVAWTRMTLLEFIIPISLFINLLWPWPYQMRFVLPLLPFMIFYILMGVRLIHAQSQRWRQIINPRAQWRVLAVLVWSLVALNIYDNAGYILEKKAHPAEESLDWIHHFDANVAMYKWIRENLPENKVIASINPPLVYLYTGRQTIGLENPGENWEKWKQLGVRYLVFSKLQVDPPTPAESKFKKLYDSNNGMNLRVVDIGPEDARLPWSTIAPGASSMKIGTGH